MTIRYTLLLPICDRPHLFESWSRKIASLNIDRAATQVILCDAAQGSAFGKRCLDFLKTIAFAELTHISYKQTDVKISGREGWRHYLNKGSYVADNYMRMMDSIKGDIVLGLEDDVEPHPDVFNSLLETLYDKPETGMVGAVTHEKNRSGKIIAFTWGIDGCIPDDNHHDLILVSAQAMGCFVTYGKIFKNHDMRREMLLEDASPDLTYCRYLRTSYGMKLYVDGRERCKHYFKSKDGVLESVGRIEGAGNTKIPEFVPFQHTITRNRRKDKAPIFVVAGTGRSGSTWIQRILNSHKDIIIWGEPHGATTAIEEMFRTNRLTQWSDICKTAASSFRQDGSSGWIANLSPMSTKPVKSYLANLYALHFNPATIDKSIWGVKTIDWSPQKVSNIYRTFPNASFIFLHRDINEVKESFNKRRNWWPGERFKDWIKRDNSMKEFENYLPYKMHHVHLDYNQWCDDSDGLCAYLEEELSLDVGSLSREAAKVNRKSFVEKS